MSSENLEVITEEEKKVPVININRNVGETNEGEIMPQKVSLEEKVIPAENENPEHLKVIIQMLLLSWIKMISLKVLMML